MKKLNYFLLAVCISALISCKGCNPSPVNPTRSEVLSSMTFQNSNGTQDSLNLRWNNNYSILYGATGFVTIGIDTQRIYISAMSQYNTYLHHLYFSDPASGQLINTLTCNYDNNGYFVGLSNVNSSSLSNFNTTQYNFAYSPVVISSDSTGQNKVYFSVHETYATSNHWTSSITIVDSIVSSLYTIDTSKKCVFTFDSTVTGSYANATASEIFDFPLLWLLECSHKNVFYKYDDLTTDYVFCLYATLRKPGDMELSVPSPVKTISYYKNDTLISSYNFTYQKDANNNITSKTVTDLGGNTLTTLYRYQMVVY